MSEEKGGEVKIVLTVKDKEGKVISKHEEEAHSWLKNYYALLAAIMRLSVTQIFTSTEGADRTIVAGSSSAWDRAADCDTNFAIGNSNAAWNVNQYKLQGYINRAKVEEVSYDKDARTVVSKATIACTAAATIKEVGILFVNANPLITSSFHFYIERTVLAVAVAVPAGGSVIVEYTISHP